MLLNLLSERYYAVALNLAIIAVAVYFAALSVGDIIEYRLAGNVVLPAAVTRAQSQSPLTRPRQAYDAIASRDIFNLTPANAAPPPVVEEPMQIQLIGTSLLSVGKSFAIVQNQNGDQQVYRVGDMIPDCGKMLAVEHDRIVVMHNGHRVAVSLPRGQGMPAEPTPGLGPGQRLRHRIPFRRPSLGRRDLRGVRRVGANQYVIDRTTVDKNVQNMAQLFTQMRAVPNLEDGKSNGFRLSEIQPGSIFQQIGLQDGDVVTAVSGQDVSNPAKAMELLPMLQNQPYLTLDVIRNGESMVLQYNIH